VSRPVAALAVPGSAPQRRGMAHVEISVLSNVVTLINVFTVTPETQEQVARALSRATDEVMKSQPGFVSASIHKSLDGRKVANYAQWRSREHFEVMLQNPAAKQHMAEIASLVERFEPTLYTVASVHSAAP
jgi:quinol monooxygenase YgiN